MKTHLLLALTLLLPLNAPFTFATDTINIANPTPGNGYTFSDHILTITHDGSYVLTGTTTANRIIISPNVIATITLRDCSITSNIASPFALDSAGCEVTLYIEGADTLISTVPDGIHPEYAGLQVEGAAALSIDGSGSLFAQGSYGSTGIGSGITLNHPTSAADIIPATGGAIHIKGGHITAKGGFYGAGIGGGLCVTTGGSITISGGVVMAIGGDFAAGIGCGYLGASPGSISITGGNIFAIGGVQGSGIGVGTNGPGNVGNINIAGGTTITASIGMNGTPVTVRGTGTVIIAGSINAGSNPDYGNAKVQTGISLSLEMLQAMAANTPYGTTLHDTLLLHDTLPADTTRDTTLLHDTIYLDTARLRDTIHLDTTEVHDTVHLDTATVYDTIHLDTTELHDTLHADTAFVHDTTLIVDTTRIPVSIHDTTHLLVSIYDTTHTSAIIIDPTLPPETLSVTDTIVHDRPVDAPTYILLEDDGGGTGLPVIASGNARALDGANGVLLEGLTAEKPFALYTTDGVLVAYATPAGSSYLLPFLPRGAYLLYHAGKWGKFVHK